VDQKITKDKMNHTITIGGKKIRTDYILALSIHLMNEAMIKLQQDTLDKIEKLKTNK